MIRKLKSGKYRLYSRKVDAKTASARILVHLRVAKRRKSTNARCSTSNADGDGQTVGLLFDRRLMEAT
jgi:hypothetical protein